MSTTDSFLAMLDKGMDNALLRYSLGNAYFAEKDYLQAVDHFKVALEHDSGYSAAWKLLGRSYIELGRFSEAVETLQQGISVASGKGDKQAEKEMSVFLRRALKNSE